MYPSIKRSNSKYRIKRLPTNQSNNDEEHVEATTQEPRNSSKLLAEQPRKVIYPSEAQMGYNLTEAPSANRTRIDKKNGSQVYSPAKNTIERGSTTSKNDKTIFNQTNSKDFYNPRAGYSASQEKPTLRTRNEDVTMFNKQVQQKYRNQ